MRENEAGAGKAEVLESGNPQISGLFNRMTGDSDGVHTAKGLGLQEIKTYIHTKIACTQMFTAASYIIKG